MLTFIFERHRETECKRGGAEREGDRIGSSLQALSCQQKPDAGLELTNRKFMTLAEVRH